LTIFFKNWYNELPLRNKDSIIWNHPPHTWLNPLSHWRSTRRHPSFATELQRKVRSTCATVAVWLLTPGKNQSEPGCRQCASLRSTGLRICQSIRDKNAKYPLSWYWRKKPRSVKMCRCRTVLPFTAQKWPTASDRFYPGWKKRIHVGRFVLIPNIAVWNAWVRTPSSRPPCVASPLLMDKHGEVVEREALFKRSGIPITQRYTHLDVHISWLRRAIELDPLKPKFLKTIRGVGYD